MGTFEKTLMIRNKAGLHARPAAIFVETANKYMCDIRLANAKGEETNGKSILGVMSLDIVSGASITVRTEGEDAQEAMSDILDLFETNFDDQE